MSAHDDGAALAALRDLCGAERGCRIAWPEWGVEVRVVARDGTAWQTTAPTLAEAVAALRVMTGADEGSA